MELRHYLKLLRKSWWFILLVCLVCGSGAAYYSSKQAPQYRASTTLALNPAVPNSTVPYFFSPSARAQELVATYNAYLKTRAFATLVVRELGLPDVDEDTIIRSIVSEGVPNTLFYRITATSTRPEYAQAIANTVAGVFIQQNLTQQQEQMRQSNQAASLAEQERQRLEDLRARLQDELDYYKTLIPVLRRQIDDLETQPSSLERDRRIVDLRAQLTQAQELSVKALTSLAEVQTRLGVANSNNTINTAIVIDQARLPGAPLPGDMTRNVLLALVAGFVLSFGSILFLEYLDYTFKTPEELEHAYGVASLSAIGIIDTRIGTKSQHEKLVTLLKPKSSAAEAFKSLRTNIQFAMTSKPIRSLLITSAGPAEGKSLTAANLAIAFAQGGQRVILVDLDLRRPTQHRMFQLQNRFGFTSLLLNYDHEFENHLQPSGVEGLRLLTSGPLPPNPTEVLNSPHTGAILDGLCAIADLVIVDSPPAATVTDAVIMAAHVDAVIQVVGAGMTRRDLVLRGRDMLRRAGARVLGPVLNQVRNSDLGYYSYYYQRYYHSSASQNAQPTLGWQWLRGARNGHANGNGHSPVPTEQKGSTPR